MRAGKNIKGSLEISAVRFMTLSKECPLSDAELSWGLLAIKRISFILNGISFVVRVRPFFRTVLHTVQYILQFCYTCAVNKTSGGPRAQEGTRTTGNTRALTHGHLKAVH
jgi:hypothetical protein